jgi:hypothetical protein
VLRWPLAFAPANAEAALDKAAREFVNHPRGAKVAGGELTVSSIYIWYEPDFGGTQAGVIEHLRRYAQPELASALATIDHIRTTATTDSERPQAVTPREAAS